MYLMYYKYCPWSALRTSIISSENSSRNHPVRNCSSTCPLIISRANNMTLSLLFRPSIHIGNPNIFVCFQGRHDSGALSKFCDRPSSTTCASGFPWYFCERGNAPDPTGCRRPGPTGTDTRRNGTVRLRQNHPS